MADDMVVELVKGRLAVLVNQPDVVEVDALRGWLKRSEVMAVTEEPTFKVTWVTNESPAAVLPGAVAVPGVPVKRGRGRPKKGSTEPTLQGSIMEVAGELVKANAEVTPKSVLAVLEGVGKAPKSGRAVAYVANQMGELVKLGRLKRVSRGRYGL
jgi:hypothetical protein